MVKYEVVMRSARGNLITIESVDDDGEVAMNKAYKDAQRLFDEVPCSYVGCRGWEQKDTSELSDRIKGYIDG